MIIYVGGLAQGKWELVQEKYRDITGVFDGRIPKPEELPEETGTLVLRHPEKEAGPGHASRQDESGQARVSRQDESGSTAASRQDESGSVPGSPEEEAGLLAERIFRLEKQMSPASKLIIITRETGSGVIPMDPSEERFREITGRLQVLLAKEAEEVYRVCCGIAVRLK